MSNSHPNKLTRSALMAGLLVVLAGPLAGCGGAMNSFDPTDWLDFLDTKKPIAGDRKAVFPEGVPGVEQGVPKELYKGAAPQQDAAVTLPPPPPAPEPKAKSKHKGAGRTAPAAQPSAAPAEADQPDAAPTEADEGAASATPPAPKPAKQKRKRTTAPPADHAQAPAAAPAPQPAAAQQPSSFPAPLPSGSFSR